MLVLKSDCSCVIYIIWYLCGEIIWKIIFRVVLVKVSKAYNGGAIRSYEGWSTANLRRRLQHYFELGRALISSVWITVGGLLLWNLVEISKLPDHHLHVGIWLLISCCYTYFCGLIIIIKGFLGYFISVV